MRPRNLIARETKLQLFKAAILPIFTDCHLVWHFCHSSDCRKLKRIQERARRAIYCDKMSCDNEFLTGTNLCSLHNRRLPDLPVAVYKAK